MIDVNWNLAPEGAVALKQDVGRWKNVTWIHADGSWWDDTDATWNTGSAERDWLQTIAVRPVTQTKTVADAVEQEGEKWTHTYSDCGVRKDCILIHDKPDIHGQVLVLNRYDEYVLTGTVELKPIKPTISKAEAWDKVCESEHEFDIVNRIKQLYDII